MYSDEKIRSLCFQALKGQGSDFQAALVELRIAFRTRIDDLSNLALATALKVGRSGDSSVSTN